MVKRLTQCSQARLALLRIPKPRVIRSARGELDDGKKPLRYNRSRHRSRASLFCGPPSSFDAMPKPSSNAIDQPETPNAPEDVKPTGTAAFSKFLAVLQCIADAKAPPGIAPLIALPGYPRPTVYRIVGALIAEGLVVESSQGGAYSLGPRLLSLASRS